MLANILAANETAISTMIYMQMDIFKKILGTMRLEHLLPRQRLQRHLLIT